MKRPKQYQLSDVINRINNMNKFEHYVMFDLCQFDDRLLTEKLRNILPELKVKKNESLLNILVGNIKNGFSKVTKIEAELVLSNFYDREGGTDSELEKMILTALKVN